MPRTINDILAIGLLLIIPVLWVTNCWTHLPDIVLGATISGWTVIIQFYFRKKHKE